MYSAEFVGLMASVQRDVKAYGVKGLADRLGISIQTMYADVDPKSVGRRSNKLGLLDYMVVLQETQNFTSLDELNRTFGRISLPIPQNEGEISPVGWMQYCATIAKESAEAVKVLADGLSNDGTLDKGRLADCEKETWEALQAFAGLYLAIKTEIAKPKTI